MNKLLIYTDGGARGNPGPGAVGIVIYFAEENQPAKKIKEISEYLGQCTNNEAEYQAVVKALQFLFENKEKYTAIKQVNFYLDSNLVVNQLNGRFKIKKQQFVNIIFTIRGLEQKLNKNIYYQYIKREQNREADYLLNQILDKKS